MEDSERQDELTFAVVCVWCGAEMRRTRAPESLGMCGRCFRRMVEEHARRAARRQACEHASDR
jgi:hypothetical protein